VAQELSFFRLILIGIVEKIRKAYARNDHADVGWIERVQKAGEEDARMAIIASVASRKRGNDRCPLSRVIADHEKMTLVAVVKNGDRGGGRGGWFATSFVSEVGSC